MKNFAKLMFLSLFAALVVSAATPHAVEASRSHATAGAFGCTTSGATNATPIVVTCTAAHGLIAGDQVRITGITGNTAADGLFYVSVPSATTLGLYADAAATASPVAGNGSYGGTGSVTIAYDVSGVTGDFTLNFRYESLTATKNVLVSVQESQDGFVSDIRTLWTNSFTGSAGATFTAQPFADVSIRKYQLPINRFGTSNTTIRVYVQAIDGSATLVSSFYVTY